MSNSYGAELPNFISERDAFLSGSRAPSDLLQNCSQNIHKHETNIQAFAHLDMTSAQSSAEASDARYRTGKPLSPIDGMPIAVKDIIDTGDMPTELNSPFFSGNRPRIDAACVAAAKSGGAIILGKSVTTEFALGRSGPTRNPYNPDHTPGGSSSGAAAGTACGMFSAGFATQTLGSIVRPASYNGVVGFKPTHGALSMAGIHPLSRTHDHLGVIGQNVDIVWALAHWIGAYAPGPNISSMHRNCERIVRSSKPQRLAVARVKGFEQLDIGAAPAFEELLEKLRGMGIALIESEQDPELAEIVTHLDQIPDMSERMVAFDMRWPFSLYKQNAPEKISDVLHEWIEFGERITLDRYQIMLQARTTLRQKVSALRQKYDGVLLPAASGPAPLGLTKTGSRTLQEYWSFLGFPAFSLPLMCVGGMPFGLQFAGFWGDDHKLAQIAKWLETHSASEM